MFMLLWESMMAASRSPSCLYRELSSDKRANLIRIQNVAAMRALVEPKTRVQVRRANPTRSVRLPGFLAMAVALSATPTLYAQDSPAAQAPVAPQPPAPDAGPIAIVPLDSKNPDRAATVTGALEVFQGKAIIVASGAITSGAETTEVVLPRRGVLRVCASTTVKLAADSSVPAGETPGLMMAMDHGAIEASFATGRNSDILLTPDFRILDRKSV